MKFKAYYYEEKKHCVITKEQTEKPIFESIKTDKNSIIINIEQKNAENIYNFFRNNTLIVMLSNEDESIEIDYFEINKKEFFQEDAFVKLVELINNLTQKTNETLCKCKEAKQDEHFEKDLEMIQKDITIDDYIESVE